VEIIMLELDQATQTELEAAAFRHLLRHLREHTEVQNIDLMHLAGFCRNCLSKWVKEAADEKGVTVDYEAVREMVYGMPYNDWKARFQK
jgi:hypothetical protein